MNTLCVAAREGRQAELPGRKQRRARGAREAVLLLAESRGTGARAVLLERRPAPGIWGGLWSPPQFATTSEALAWCVREVGPTCGPPEALGVIEHAFTHFDLTLTPLRVVCAPRGGVRDADAVREAEARLWYPLDAPPRVGLPQPILELLERLMSMDAA